MINIQLFYYADIFRTLYQNAL